MNKLGKVLVASYLAALAVNDILWLNAVMCLFGYAPKDGPSWAYTINGFTIYGVLLTIFTIVFVAIYNGIDKL